MIIKVLKKYCCNYQIALYAVVFATFFFVPINDVHAQQTVVVDTTTESSDSIQKDTVKKHSPKKATIMSACLPGLGQVYNKKYWKVPVIYAGLGATAYFMSVNNDKRHFYDNKRKNKLLSSDEIKLATDGYNYYERNFELNIFIIGGIYLANIIDASVDGYFFDYDVSKNLSFHISPTLLDSRTMGVAVNFRIR